MRNTGTFHFEALECPIACGDGSFHTGGDVVAVQFQVLVCIEFRRASRFLENFVYSQLEVVVELFEEVFEEKRKHLACQL